MFARVWSRAYVCGTLAELFSKLLAVYAGSVFRGLWCVEFVSALTGQSTDAQPNNNLGTLGSRTKAALPRSIQSFVCRPRVVPWDAIIAPHLIRVLRHPHCTSVASQLIRRQAAVPLMVSSQSGPLHLTTALATSKGHAGLRAQPLREILQASGHTLLINWETILRCSQASAVRTFPPGGHTPPS